MNWHVFKIVWKILRIFTEQRSFCRVDVGSRLFLEFLSQSIFTGFEYEHGYFGLAGNKR